MAKRKGKSVMRLLQVFPADGARAVFVEDRPNDQKMLVEEPADFLGLAIETPTYIHGVPPIIVGIKISGGMQWIQNQFENFAGIVLRGQDINECRENLEEHILNRLPPLEGSEPPPVVQKTSIILSNDFVLTFPVYFPIVFADSINGSPHRTERIADGARGVAAFTVDLHAERDCAAWDPRATICKAEDLEQLREACVRFRRGLGIHYLTLDGQSKDGTGAFWLDFEEFGV